MLEATPEFLSLYGLDPVAYGPYRVATQQNLPNAVRLEGLNVNYRQALTFLPPWARGVQFYANGSAQRTANDTGGNFSGFIPRGGSWGLSLSRPAYNLRMNWNYLGRQRQGVVNGRSLEAGTYTWGSKRSYQSLHKFVHKFDRRSMDFFFSASAFYPILSDTGRNAETDPSGVSARLSAVS